MAYEVDRYFTTADERLKPMIHTVPSVPDNERSLIID
jgi:hypothetical protein